MGAKRLGSAHGRDLEETVVCTEVLIRPRELVRGHPAAKLALWLFVVSPTARDQKVIFNILALKQFVCYIF